MLFLSLSKVQGYPRWIPEADAQLLNCSNGFRTFEHDVMFITVPRYSTLRSMHSILEIRHRLSLRKLLHREDFRSLACAGSSQDPNDWLCTMQYQILFRKSQDFHLFSYRCPCTYLSQTRQGGARPPSAAATSGWTPPILQSRTSPNRARATVESQPQF